MSIKSRFKFISRVVYFTDLIFKPLWQEGVEVAEYWCTTPSPSSMILYEHTQKVVLNKRVSLANDSWRIKGPWSRHDDQNPLSFTCSVTGSVSPHKALTLFTYPVRRYHTTYETISVQVATDSQEESLSRTWLHYQLLRLLNQLLETLISTLTRFTLVLPYAIILTSNPPALEELDINSFPREGTQNLSCLSMLPLLSDTTRETLFIFLFKDLEEGPEVTSKMWDTMWMYTTKDIRP